MTESVTCRYCNMKFPIYKLEKGLGSCYPIKIAGKTEQGKYLISLAALEERCQNVLTRRPATHI